MRGDEIPTVRGRVKYPFCRTEQEKRAGQWSRQPIFSFNPTVLLRRWDMSFCMKFEINWKSKNTKNDITSQCQQNSLIWAFSTSKSCYNFSQLSTLASPTPFPSHYNTQGQPSFASSDVQLRPDSQMVQLAGVLLPFNTGSVFPIPPEIACDKCRDKIYLAII